MSAIRFTCKSLAPIKPFPHFWEHTVGSCNAAMVLRADWQKQITRCKNELGFQHVRFHNLLNDDFGTVVKKDGKYIYSFFNADQICDFLLSIGMKPFVELSFMPKALASGKETVFSYEGNITPPKDYDEWQKLVHALVMHWIERYGLEEVSKWYFEVWNEPNLRAFWKGTKNNYFKLYKCTATTIKSIHNSLKVGGPATAKNEWIKEFVDFCKKNNVPFDFISTHHYPTDAFGSEDDDTVEQLAKSRRSILQQQARKVKKQAGKKPVYYTEWSSSSNSADELHDQPYAACFIVKTVMEATGIVDGYSYWTFSDIFAETDFSSVPFHGGFGLLNIYNIPKPAYRAFQLLHGLGTGLLTTEGKHKTVDVWITRKETELKIIITNWALPKHPIKEETIRIELEGFKVKAKGFIERIDENHANAWKIWEEKGKPGTLMPDVVTELEKASTLLQENFEIETEKNTPVVSVTMPPQGLACITLEMQPESSSELPQISPQDEKMIDALQRVTMNYFLKEVNPETGLVADSSQKDSPASIAAVGLAISCYVTAAEIGLLQRNEAVKKITTVLNFLEGAHQGVEADATGYKGFYYHFLDMKTGKRAANSELSTIDTAILIAGALSAQNYFTDNNEDEKQLRELVEKLYVRVDWQWATNGADTITHGWKPESGFLSNRWNSKYCEAHILYILALGSPSFPINAEGYKQWASTFEWKKIYGIEYFFAAPLFIHHFSQIWLDFKGIYDEANKKAGIDYFENSVRALYVQQKYAIENPLAFEGYGEYVWGFTACDGPGPCIKTINGVQREFFNYIARGVPFGPDDGTISPCSVTSSIPFAPAVVLQTINNITDKYKLNQHSKYGFDGSFNPTFPEKKNNQLTWTSEKQYALNKGPVILMIANYRKHLIWDIMKKSPHIIRGLKQAGFTGGWLDKII